MLASSANTSVNSDHLLRISLFMKSYIYHLVVLLLWIVLLFVYPHKTLIDPSHDRDPAVYIAHMQSVGEEMLVVVDEQRLVVENAL